MTMIDRLIDAMCKALQTVMVLLLALMVVLVLGNVVLRYAFNSGITVSEELSRWFFVWMTFLGAAVGLRQHGHLGTDVMVGRLGRNGRRACLLVAQALMLWMTWLIFSGSLVQTRINWSVEAPVSGLSQAWVSGVGVVFALLTGPMLLRDLWRTLRGRIADEELVLVRDNEDAVHVQPAGEDEAAGRKS